MESTQPQHELAYKRKAKLRGKNRKVRIEMVSDPANIVEADRKARKGKKHHRGVRVFDRDRQGNLDKLKHNIDTGAYHTSPGTDVEQKCPCGKIRLLHKLPYFPDHIAHHAMMQVVMPVMMRYYYFDSSASIPGKGMHFAKRRTEKWIDKNKDAGRLYYCKLDFVKFYHNIDQRKCYDALCRTFGNRGIRYLLREAVTACRQGLGIGLYPIQPIANFYTCEVCRMVMARYDVFLEIYCDDIVIMSRDKRQVWKAVNYVQVYAKDVFAQPLHDNVGVQIIDRTHFLDFVGYRFYIGRTWMRKSMKIRFKRKMARLSNEQRRYQVATSYRGWLKHCDGLSLWKAVMKMNTFDDLNIPELDRRDKDGRRILEGTRTSIAMLLNRQLVFTDCELGVKSKYDRPGAVVQVRDEQGNVMKFVTSSPRLIQIFEIVSERKAFPFTGRVVNNTQSGYANYDIKS